MSELKTQSMESLTGGFERELGRVVLKHYGRQAVRVYQDKMSLDEFRAKMGFSKESGWPGWLDDLICWWFEVLKEEF